MPTLAEDVHAISNTALEQGRIYAALIAAIKLKAKDGVFECVTAKLSEYNAKRIIEDGFTYEPRNDYEYYIRW